MDSILALHPVAPGLILVAPKSFNLMLINNNALNGGQRLENVKQSHLLLASGWLMTG